MKVLTHQDSQTLERELLARVDAVHPREGLGRTLIVVPTSRLAGHVARRLTGVRPAWLGLEVRHFQALAHAVLAGSPAATPRVAGRLLRESLLEGILGRLPRNFWADFARRRPGVVRRILESLNDLREAGIEPAAALPCLAGTPRGADLAEVFREYHAALEARLAAGWTDAAGLARAALPHAAAWAKGVQGAFLHGAYEVVGVHLDLLREIDRACGVTALVPLSPGAPATQHAEGFARAFLLAPGGASEQIASGCDPLRAARLLALYDEESRPTAAPAGHFTLRHAQGPTAEVQGAVRAALVQVREGCPPAEIAIVARSLERYATALEQVFSDANLPWSSSLGGPLRRQPIVRDFLLALAVADDDFPRRATAELLRSPRIRWSALNGDGVPRGDRADLWSRRAKIIGGLDEWTVGLSRWAQTPGRGSQEPDPAAEIRAARRLADVSRIGTALAALDAALPRGNSASWSGHAAALRALFDAYFAAPPGDSAAAAAQDALLALVADMARLETFAADARPIPFGEMRTWLEQAVDGAELPASPDDRGGLCVLDAMQLRGLTFRHIHWLGFNSDLFPRPPREDVVLTDAERRALGQATSRPLPIKTESLAEERLLLVLLLGAAAERVDLSWQRADEAGRARTPSPALREISRLAFGRPDAPAAQQAATHLPSHPQHWLEAQVETTGLLSPDEALLLAALRVRDATAIGALAERAPDLARGVKMLQATQAFASPAGEYDGRIGPLPAAETLSVSAVEQLGRCPLQFFFAKVLGVGEFEEQADALSLTSQELGTQIHTALETIYATLRQERLFEPPAQGHLFAPDLVERGLALWRERQDELLGDVLARFARRLPLLGRHFQTQWFQTVERFLRFDLTKIEREGWRVVSLEELREQRLDLGQGVTLGLRGKFDRLLALGDRRCVGDYKVSAALDRRVDVTKMLKGETLQVPLYWKMAGPGATVELLAIHPDADPETEAGRAVFSSFDKPEIERSFDDTLRTLVALWRDGRFTFREDRHCSWCHYEKACRRHHPASQEREDSADDAAAYRRAGKKTQRKPDGA